MRTLQPTSESPRPLALHASPAALLAVCAAVLTCSAPNAAAQCGPREAQFLTAAIPAPGDYFGSDVAVLGRTAVIGAMYDDWGGMEYAGSARVFEYDGASWTGAATLTAPDGADGAMFGQRVAIWGDTIAVGSPTAGWVGPASAGAVYVYTRPGPGGGWTLQAELAASDAVNSAFFGSAVAGAGDTLIIGAPRAATPASPNGGAAYIFTRRGTQWVQQAKLTAVEAGEYATFGFAVCLSAEGDAAVISAVFANQPGAPSSGGVYIYSRGPAGGGWGLQAALAGPTPASDNWFGRSCALWGHTLIVGAPHRAGPAGAECGAAYIFERTGGVWGPLPAATLTASDAAARDLLGWATALNRDTALVTAPGDNANAGSAYIFTRSAGTWSQQAKLSRGGGEFRDSFGASAALSGDCAFIGIQSDDLGFGGPLVDAGSTVVYTLRGVGVESGPADAVSCRGGAASFRITPTGAPPFTYRWRKDGSPLLDQPGHIAGAQSGSLELTGITPDDAGRYDCTVANTCGQATSAPAALTLCLADINCDGFTDYFDHADFIAAFESGDLGGGADFNADGFLDFADYTAFITAFEAGC